MASSWVPGRDFFRDERFAAAGLLAGVTTRALGDMKSAAARAAALDQAGLGGRSAFFLKQVHSTGIVPVGRDSRPEPVPEGDGLITDLSGPVLGVFVADCAPLFLWSAGGRAAGLFHVGWRGSLGMPRQAVAALVRRYGLKPGELEASLGPHIGSCCYRVGPETATRFEPRSLARRGGELFLDLTAQVKAQLVEAGVREEAFEASPACTSCQGERFFSFRREKQDSRMMAFLALP